MSDNVSLVALTPGDMTHTQQALSAWCTRKVAAVQTELADLEEHLLIAKANGWRLSGLQSSINRSEKRVEYYRRMKAAVDEGFVLVPNFPAEVLAVRVREDAAPHVVTQSQWSSALHAKPQQLPAGEGRYVDDRIPHRDESFDEVIDGKTKTVRQFVGDEYDDVVDFPFKGVKPAVLDAVGRAMSLKVFDRISLVRNQGTDPIFIGELIDPRGNDRRVTFFIAWWLNTEDL